MNFGESANKLLVIGLDGASLELVSRWASEGLLPSFGRLLKNGSSGTLRSTIPALTPTAWTSLFTGKNPGKHGAYEFLRRRRDSYELDYVRNDLPRLGTIFRLFSDAGKRVAAINVPFTYPPEPINGIMIAGLGAPDNDRFVYPLDLVPYLKASGYTVNNNFRYDPSKPEAFLSQMEAATSRRGVVICDLQKQESWDFFMVVFRDIDTVQTHYWHNMDESHPQHKVGTPAILAQAIASHYQQVDEIIGRLLAQTDERTGVFVVTDHGGGPIHREVFLNNWLRQHGYLALKPRAHNADPVRAMLRKLGVTRRSVVSLLGWPAAERLKNLLPLAEKWLPWAAPSLAEAVDWKRTYAFAVGHMGQIYLNQAGREPEGIVALADRNSVLDKISRDLDELRDPVTGDKVVEEVFRREDLYHGPLLESAPDLNVVFTDLRYSAHVGFEFEGDTIFDVPAGYETGMHRMDGVFIASGPNIATGRIIHNAGVLDIAPTLLNYAGLSVPSDMDGAILSNIYVRPPLVEKSDPPVLTEDIPDVLTSQESEHVSRHLRDLGYIE